MEYVIFLYSPRIPYAIGIGCFHFGSLFKGFLFLDLFFLFGTPTITAAQSVLSMIFNRLRYTVPHSLFANPTTMFLRCCAGFLVLFRILFDLLPLLPFSFLLILFSLDFSTFFCFGFVLFLFSLRKVAFIIKTIVLGSFNFGSLLNITSTDFLYKLFATTTHPQRLQALEYRPKHLI